MEASVGLLPNRLECLHFETISRKKVRPTMFREHAHLAHLLVRESEREQGVRAIGESKENALAGREVVRGKTIAILSRQGEDSLPIQSTNLSRS